LGVGLSGHGVILAGCGDRWSAYRMCSVVGQPGGALPFATLLTLRAASEFAVFPRASSLRGRRDAPDERAHVDFFAAVWAVHLTSTTLRASNGA
jgi:hypothetical protein